MNTWSPPPTLDNFDRGVRYFYNDGGNWLHTMFAAVIFVVSNDLPAKASAETLKRETGRKVVWWLRTQSEDGWRLQGVTVNWSPDDCEAIALEIAERVARHPAVAARIDEMLETKRDEVFADWSLTHGDELFVVYQCRSSDIDEHHRSMFERIGAEHIKEKAIETIIRSLDYIEDIRSTKDFRKFIRLKRILTSLLRVHAVAIRP